MHLQSLEVRSPSKFWENEYDNSDWMLGTRKWDLLQLSHGPYNKDVYHMTYGSGNNNINKGCTGVKAGRSLMNDAYWNSPVFTRQELMDAAVRQLTDFDKQPLETKFAFCGPDVKGMPHKQLLDSTCERSYEFKAGDEDVFTIPNRRHFIPARTKYDANGPRNDGPIDDSLFIGF